MNYDWLTYEEIKKTKHPNLLAELKESGYSICTVSEHMGHGKCEEGNQYIWNKLVGSAELYASEIIGLAGLFGAKFDYLFADKLSIISGKSQAYWRWYDDNKRKQTEFERNREIRGIYDKLVADAELLVFIKWCISLSNEERMQVIRILNNQKEGD